MSSQIMDIPVRDIHPHPANPRLEVGDVSELADSIKAQGIRQNLLVVPLQEREERAQYQLVIGHRRYAAACQAGLESVPCAVADLSETEQLELMLVENTQRTDLTASEEADGMQGLLDLGVKATTIAERTGRSRSYVRDRLKLAAIPASTRDAAADYAQLSLKELQALAEFQDDPDTQEALARVAGTSEWQWHLKQARDERERAQWAQDAQHEAQRLGLSLMPDEIKCDQYGHFKGFDLDKIFFRSGGSFASQWKEYAADNTHQQPVTLRITTNGMAEAYESSKTDESNAEALAEKQHKAERRAYLHDMRQYAATSRQVREEWLADTIGKLKTLELRRLTSSLAYLLLADDSSHSFRSFFGLGSDAMRAYDKLTAGSLPYHDENHEAGIYTMTCKDNWKTMRDRQRRQPDRELPILLASLIEASITSDAWNGNRGTLNDLIRPYYQILEDSGYPISQDEKQALDGYWADMEAAHRL